MVEEGLCRDRKRWRSLFEAQIYKSEVEENMFVTSNVYLFNFKYMVLCSQSSVADISKPSTYRFRSNQH